MRGRDVTVLVPVLGPVDRFGNQTTARSVQVDVSGVLIAPGVAVEMNAPRPDGVVVALTLHFPKTWGGESLRGCDIEVHDGPWAGMYRVIGDPKPYDERNTPTRWNFPVEVEAADG